MPSQQTCEYILTSGEGGGIRLTTAGWDRNRAHPCGVELSLIEAGQLQLSDGFLRRGRGSLPVIDQGLCGQLPPHQLRFRRGLQGAVRVLVKTLSAAGGNMSVWMASSISKTLTPAHFMHSGRLYPNATLLVFCAPQIPVLCKGRRTGNVRERGTDQSARD